MLLAGCSSGDYSPAPTSAPATTATTSAPEVTVRGIVAGTFASARVVTLRQPVNGLVNVALTTETEVVRSNGTRAGINDVVAGATVEAVGRPSAPDTLLARRLVILS